VTDLINKKIILVNSKKIAEMHIQHEEKEDGKGSFFVMGDDSPIAEMTYTTANKNLMIIQHTEVDDILKGKHAGHQLINAAVSYARQKGLKIFPLCPFVKAVFTKNEELYKDVWNK
jgi:predicted GNAT family acetyltransferase